MGTLEGDAHGRSVTYLSASSRYAEIDSEVVTEQSRKDTIVGRQMYKQIAIMEVTISQVGTPMEDKQSFFSQKEDSGIRKFLMGEGEV